MSPFTQPPTVTNKHGFTVKQYRTSGPDLTLFEYLRRDLAALGHSIEQLSELPPDHPVWRQPERLANAALMALHDWSATHSPELHDALESAEDRCLGVGPGVCTEDPPTPTGADSMDVSLTGERHEALLEALRNLPHGSWAAERLRNAFPEMRRIATTDTPSHR